ncbi:MAG: AI-2E family transporter, partial [Verrucomicrobiae bacterium]|nr:AI-2E family transporter [Verrucomicrobiae bacterium]
MKRQSVRKFWKAESWLGGLALLLLLAGCVWVIKPFFTALMWAIILTYSLYPLQRLFTRWFRGSRTLAACLVTLTVTVLVAGPVVLVGLSLSQDGKDLALATRKWFISISDEPPEWARGIPIVGDEVATYWTQFAEDRDRWMAQLDKEVVNAPRPKIVVRDGEEAELLDAPPVRADETDDAADTNVRRDPPHL